MPLDGDFLLSIHADVPGIVGRVGSLLGNRDQHCKNGPGREQKGGKALLLISIDNPVDSDVVKEMRSTKEFRRSGRSCSPSWGADYLQI